jgi:hypothetical protein
MVILNNFVIHHLDNMDDIPQELLYSYEDLIAMRLGVLYYIYGIPLEDGEFSDFMDDAGEPQKKEVTLRTESIEYSSIKTTCSTCSVCQEDFASTSVVSAVDCKHVFHTACISEWVKHKAECPNCKSSIDVIES